MAVINFVFDSQGVDTPMVRYVLQFLRQHPLSPQGVVILENQKKELGSLSIGYGERKSKFLFFIPRQRLVFQHTTPVPETLIANAYQFKNFTVFSVEQESKGAQHFMDEYGYFGFDLIETLFFHISRFEEYYYLDARKNEHGEMDEEHHFLVRHGLQRIPVVDHLVFCFFSALGLEPKALQTSFFLTHDVDFITKFTSVWHLLRPALKFLLLRPNLSALKKLIISYVNKLSGKRKDPYDVFDWMLQEKESDKKILFIMAGGKTKYDGDYEPNGRRITRIIELARQRGYQIGLHPSYNTWRDFTTLKSERLQLELALGQEVRHSRQHYLHYDHRITPYILEALGIELDSSMGYNQRIGFRCGTGFPYQLFSFQEQRAFSFWEAPLAVMDSAILKESAYQLELFECIWREILDSNSGLTQITFNFHNSRFDDAWLHGIPLETYLQEVIEKL